MKTICWVLALSFGLAAKDTVAQRKYITSGGEMIFSWASANLDGADVTTITRFSPVVNIQIQFHYDPTEKAGLFTGISLRNVGFIYEDPQTEAHYKVRTYTLGLPVGFKVGSMGGTFLFAGYELELAFNYKQKTFVDSNKEDKFSVWFGKQTPLFYHSLLAGVQTRQGVQLKFKYYLTNFFNKGYTTYNAVDALYAPYANFDANVFYVSLSIQILKGTKFYHSDNYQARK